MHLLLICLLFLALWAHSGVYRVYGKRDLFGKKKKKTSGWTMLWQDEFDYFDENKWEYQYQDGCHYGVCLWGNNEKVRTPCSNGSHPVCLLFMCVSSTIPRDMSMYFASKCIPRLKRSKYYKYKYMIMNRSRGT